MSSPPSKRRKSSDKSTSTHSQERCFICNTGPNARTGIFARELTCGHPAHTNCLRRWRKKLCPVCLMRSSSNNAIENTTENIVRKLQKSFIIDGRRMIVADHASSSSEENVTDEDTDREEIERSEEEETPEVPLEDTVNTRAQQPDNEIPGIAGPAEEPPAIIEEVAINVEQPEQIIIENLIWWYTTTIIKIILNGLRRLFWCLSCLYMLDRFRRFLNLL
ncbi:hypothetical protein AVEN_102725-1 [Araneus ventricosus]|uniref:RING-type domain-containing protein n=1 Tax=Araneus ventricosus TaxID=182803 RepID=A0A4Y2REW1_ARAVE|nr:hypothetical protein AVEN_271623-1 [Araneus ventricosus]GBN68396.1 hypothetical protein AVEN_107775-1 [Araneus ventricosus]GBN73920.1 hypothetical protein AVEN_164254-1 [Araneus ventricosus]GBN73986.1 hypothetical protein AVEN_102725-1 [Araneus ventricosus]